MLAPDANGTERKGAFTLAPDGTLTGSVDTSHSGPEGADLRTVLKYTDEKERRESLGNRSLPTTCPAWSLNSFQFVQPPALDKPLEVHYKLTAQQYAHQAGHPPSGAPARGRF